MRESAALRIFLDEISNARFWVLLCIGLVCFLAATVWDSSFFSDPGWVERESKLLWFQQSKNWIGVLKELGYASLIALLISVVVEQSSRARQEETTARRQQEIAESVFRGVFESDLPRELVDEVVDGVLRSKFVRTEHICTYSLTDGSETIDGQTFEFVKLEFTSAYSLQNVSREEIEVPIRLNFPLPGNRRLRDLAKLTSFVIDDRDLSPEEMQQGDDEVPNTDFLQCYQWNRTLSPGETIRVRANAILIKERSDNEIFTTLYPSISMRLNVNMHCQNMEFGAESHHRAGIKKVSGRGTDGHHEWELDRPLLPNQGIVFWWRPESPD